MSELSGYINKDRLVELKEFQKQGHVEWLGQGDLCKNCNKITSKYNLWISGRTWHCHNYCPVCHFDTWEESTWWFNFNIMIF
ncbi:MAG: hypothetical protein KAS02_01455 [Candidatus Pacebacteria bacterium]|nr:hypothetical protein [Candidatus Paceibacterota bacterium]